MKTKWFTNPYFIYTLSFLAVFIVYSLNWSSLYPLITKSLYIFLFVSFLFSFFLGFVHEKLKLNAFVPISKLSYSTFLIILLYIGYLLEFIYSGGIPLIRILLESGYGYKDFTGIPTFHVILGTFNIYYSVLLFHAYLSLKKKKQLYIFILSIVPYLLIINRGALVIVLLACLFMYLMKVNRISFALILKLMTGLFIFLFIFGVIGNSRSELSKENKEYVLKIGGATDDFIESNIPFEYYWAYLYIATPIGNFQNLINEKNNEFSIKKTPDFLIKELTPDFLSKQLSKVFLRGENGDDNINYLVVASLNAVPVYFGSYFLLGWVGVCLMFLFSMAIMLFYPLIIGKNSKFFVSSWCILTSLVCMNVFGNMWYVLGTVLLWPMIFRFFEKYRFITMIK